MGKIRFKIDEKSLYYGIYNNYDKGEVMTSSTPINQSKDPNKWHRDIINFMESGLDTGETIPEGLLRQLTRKTTSLAKTRINHLFVFKKITFNGVRLNTPFEFAIYVKEEIDEIIKRRDGTFGPNTHLGRMKLHYPSKIKYNRDGYNIDNKAVLQAIIDHNGGFAYIVRGFEVDLETKTLNFVTSLIGLGGIFLSSVFKVAKGVGKKLLLDEINLEAQDLATDSLVIIATNAVNNSSSELDFDALRRTQAENGKLGEQYIFEHLAEYVHTSVNDLYHTSKHYPTSPYDMEYVDDEGVTRYIEVKSTSGSKEVFNMSSGELKFMKEYKDRYLLLLVTNVRSPYPNVKPFDGDRIMRLRKEYPSVRFYAN